jgi:RHS repeat-associated protein
MKNSNLKKFVATKTARVIATFLLVTLLLPITTPIPVWASNLNLPKPVDNGFRLTAPTPLFSNSTLNFVGNLASNFGMITGVTKSEGSSESEKNFNKEALEARLENFETQMNSNKVVKVGQIIPLSSIPLDGKNNPINGLSVQWKTSDSNILQIVNESQAVALKEGESTLTVSSGKKQKEFRVKIANNNSIKENLQSKAVSRNASYPLTFDEPQIILSEQQAVNLTTSENNLGNPVGQTEMGSLSPASAMRTRERIGSANYSFGIPLASLPGRGLDASVGISYNSRLWNKSTSGTTDIYDFNTDKNWLAPGFRVGFGEIKTYNAAGGIGLGYLLTDSDGTRHQLEFKQNSNDCYLFESNDGTFIRATNCGNVYVKVQYPDGTNVEFGASNQESRRFPTVITDRNGNKMLVSYVEGDSAGKIASIKDTLNRYITFHYDTTSDKKLVAVRIPGFGDSSTPIQTIRFYYEDIPLNSQGRFHNPLPGGGNDVLITAPTSIKVLRYVYFPSTQTGYKYDYSQYFGMITKTWQLRGMQVDGNALDNTGAVTNEGVWSAWTHYNYAAFPTDLGGVPLTDVPKFSWRKDDWLGRTTPSIAQTFFSTDKDVQVNPQGREVGNRLSKITSPDGITATSVSKINETEWDDGLLTETRLSTLENGVERVWSKTNLFWEQGQNLPTGRDNPRLNKLVVTNDAGQKKASTFEYDSYNNQTVAREYDFEPTGQPLTELRRIETTYETGVGWINNRLLRLPKMSQTIVNNVVVSKTTIEYDNNGASGASNLTLRPNIDLQTHDYRFNPSVVGQTYCVPGCTSSYCCNWIPGYDPATDFRGNVTKVTSFSDATLETDSNASVTTMKYDIAGNEVEAGVNCCRKKTWEYVKENEFAYAISETKGNTGQLTLSSGYDRNTGLMKSATDENGKTTSITYDPITLRQTRIDLPNGGWSTSELNISTYPFFAKQTSSLDSGRSVSSWSFADGRGQNFRSMSQTIGGYYSNDVEFDVMGRGIKSFSPYLVSSLSSPRPNDVKFVEVNERDGLGRVTKTKLTDNTFVNASFNGTTVIATDQAGKTRRQVADSLGRTIRVDEPNANGILDDNSGNPIQPTFYEYDGNDNLSKVTQSDGVTTQERLFKYDSLSRLTHEKQVEANATLNNDGVFVGTNGLWTGFYKYDSQSLISEGIDARGVKTKFTYDGLNRVQTVKYFDETGYKTPNVTYTYDEARGTFSNNGRLTTVQTEALAAQGTPETKHLYDYSNVGQVVNHTQTIGNQSYNMTYGYNLAGQLTIEKYPSGKIFNYSVDDFGRLQNVSDNQRTYLNGVIFNDKGLLTQMNLGNGTSEIFGYNDRFQMTSQNLNKGSQVLQKYDYGYGQIDTNGDLDLTKNNGQLGKVESFIGTAKQSTQKFSYDSIGRLIEAKEFRGDNNVLTYKEHFDFDRFGNMYRKASNNGTAGQANPLPFTPIEDSDISKSTNRFTTATTYDNAGAVISDNKFRSTNFAYDANGRQVKASKVSSPDAFTVYDALGNRVATKINDVWQFIIYDAFGKLVAEYGTQGEGNGGVSYIFQDRLGSVRASLNSNGFIQARFDFSAFGEEVGLGVGMRSIEQGYSGDTTSRNGYGSTEKDSTGLNHTWFRKMEQRAGRWTNPDPDIGSMRLGSPQSFNRYIYVGNDPINLIDPSGLDAVGDAVSLAQDLLKSAPCKSLFKKHRVGDPSKLLGEISKRGDIKVTAKVPTYSVELKTFVRTKTGDASFGGSVAKTVYVPGKKGSFVNVGIFIDQNGQFFNPGYPKLSLYIGSNVFITPENRNALVLIHELLHWAGRRTDAASHQKDFNEAIYSLCMFINPKWRRDNEPITSEPGVLNETIPQQPLYLGYGSGGYGGGFPSWYYALQQFLAEINSLGQQEYGEVTGFEYN